MAHSFGTRPKQASENTPHQDRVYDEMFRAIELLGRKLERVEGERSQLAQRLSLIESAATVDEQTGKLYLPAVVDPSMLPPPTQSSTPKWIVAASLMSSVTAMLALMLVIFQTPAQTLTPKQLAALNTMSSVQLTQLDSKSWKNIYEEDGAVTPALKNITAEELSHIATASGSDTPPAADFTDPLPYPAPAATEGFPLSDIDIAATGAIPASEVEVAADIAAIPDMPAVSDTAVADIFIPGEDIAPAAEETALAAIEAPKAIEKAAPPVKLAAAPVAEASPVKTPPVKTPSVTTQAKPKPVAPQTTPPVETASGSRYRTEIAPDPNLPEGLADLERRAFERIPAAEHDLAAIYAAGTLTKQDYKRAAFWFFRAADGGIANAHYNLGVMFQQGLGLRTDMGKALAWYKSAADLGHPEAMYNLGIAYIEGIGTTRNIQTGAAYFRDAANAGVAQAAFNLGVLYESNFMGPIDTEKAAEWYSVAANEGHQDAEIALARLGVTTVAGIEPAAGEYGEGDSSPR